MADELSGAVDQLEKKLQKQLQEAGKTKKLINSLLEEMGQPARYADADADTQSGAPIKRDAYYGKPLATAVTMVLKRFGEASTAEEIIKGLEKGGFDFRPLKWSENVRHRNLAISMAKNTQTFHKLPNGTFGLREWYDAEILKKTERVKDKESGAGAEAQPDDFLADLDDNKTA
jgi:hypothetical protein